MSILEELQAKAQESSAPIESAPAEHSESVQDLDNAADDNADAPAGDVENPDKASEQQAEKQTEDTPGKPAEASENKEKVFANEELTEVNDYLSRNPGKTYDDYRELKKPTAEIDEEQLLRDYFSEKEGMTPSEIAYELKQLEVDEIDDDFGDADDLETLKRKAQRERLLRNAREWREDFVKTQLGGKENQPDALPKTAEELMTVMQKQQEQQVQNYRTTIYETLPQIETIELTVGGGKVHFTPDEEFRKEMRLTSEDVSTVTKQYFDENGQVKDPKGFITEAALWVNPKTRQKMIDFMIDQEVLRDRAARDKQRRNINLDNVRATEASQALSGEEALENFRRSRLNTSF